MGISVGHLALLLVIVLVVFGAGKLPQIMGDLARGAKAFKDGLKDGEKPDRTNNLPDDKNPAP